MPTPFEIPDQMRDAANRSVDQAKKAFQQFLDAARKAAAAAEGSAKSFGVRTADINRQALAFVEGHIAASFDLAQGLAQARTFEEMTALQQQFLKRQMEALASKTPTADIAEAPPTAAPTHAVLPERRIHSKDGLAKSTQSPPLTARSKKRSAPKSVAKKSKGAARNQKAKF